MDLDLAHLRPILGVLAIALGHFQTLRGFWPYIWAIFSLRALGPGFGPFSAYFGGSRTRFEPFWGLRYQIWPIVGLFWGLWTWIRTIFGAEGLYLLHFRWFWIWIWAIFCLFCRDGPILVSVQYRHSTLAISTMDCKFTMDWTCRFCSLKRFMYSLEIYKTICHDNYLRMYYTLSQHATL